MIKLLFFTFFLFSIHCSTFKEISKNNDITQNNAVFTIYKDGTQINLIPSLNFDTYPAVQQTYWLGQIAFFRQKINRKETLYFFNIQSIKNYINHIDLEVYCLKIWTDQVKKKLLNKIIAIQKCSPYQSSCYEMSSNDTIISYFLKILEDIANQKIIQEEVLNESLEKIVICKIGNDYTVNLQEDSKLQNVTNQSDFSNQKDNNDHATIDPQDLLKKEDKESTPSQKKGFLKIKDKNSNGCNIIYYKTIYKHQYPLQKLVETETEAIIQKMESGETIFFTNLNAIKNYIYFAIGYTSNIINDYNKRKILLNFCTTLSQRPPYNDSDYTFKPEDREIINLLEILEKIDNKTLTNDEDLKLQLEKITNQKSDVIVKENNIQIPQTKTNSNQKIQASLNTREIKKQNPPPNTTQNNKKSGTENSDKKNPSLKKHSIIKYLFGFALCAASLICMYKFFNPYILKKIYQSS